MPDLLQQLYNHSSRRVIGKGGGSRLQRLYMALVRVQTRTDDEA
jgi:hypothetical protein